MNYTDTQPLVQCALDAVMQPQEEITIPSDIVKSGVLYVASGMPSFRQTAAPELVVQEQADGKENGVVILASGNTTESLADMFGKTRKLPVTVQCAALSLFAMALSRQF
ncbi:MAG: hypothetical protein LKE64_10590 [Solobacterium sp.]|jgi:hypothetical protein|nr:hypothetical protein [Solobacterium sp.]MCH4014754.1 hypothetical protein [Solobacterium sp.]MCH4048329.1 hypothetical protein [Solobacterium sp.]MCH4048371.1 hypothetical protein [Solobacterium sp.]MCH4074777.1 hypothetical protein [Solobacterium sp.]